MKNSGIIFFKKFEIKRYQLKLMIDAKYYVVYGSRYVVVSIFRLPAIRVLSGSTIMLIYGFKVRIYGCLCGNFILRKKMLNFGIVCEKYSSGNSIICICVSNYVIVGVIKIRKNA